MNLLSRLTRAALVKPKPRVTPVAARSAKAAPGTGATPACAPAGPSEMLVGMLDQVLPGEGLPGWLDAILPGGATGRTPWNRTDCPPGTEAPASGQTPAPTTGQTPAGQQGQGSGQTTAEPVTEQPAPEVVAEPVAPVPVPATRCTVVDNNALIRQGPPNYSPIGGTLPVGMVVDVLSVAIAGGTEIARVRQVLDADTVGPPAEYWTAASNLRNHKEDDATMVPTGQIPLAGLSGLDRTMAVIFNSRGAYISSQAAAYGISEADVAAVLQVESGGKAFSPVGAPIMRFENHIFWSEWGSSNRERYNQHFAFDREGKAWTGHVWRRDPAQQWQMFHGQQTSELEVLNFARTLDDTAALRSASYGAGQVMGFNHRTLGYETPQAMYEAFSGGVRAQFDGMFSYFENTSALAALRTGDYTGFARSYNGNGQAEYYGGLIRDAAAAYRRVRPSAAAS
jgi:hypothetical protein